MKRFIRHHAGVTAGVCCFCLVAVLVGCEQRPRETGRDAASPKAGGEVEVTAVIAEEMSCDGTTKVELPADMTGQARADELLSQWRQSHPGRDWVAYAREAHALIPPADNSDILKGEQGKDHAYGTFTETDILIWARETEKFVAEGSRIFHDADALGSTVATSCDMCHPHASNTHPETYPKFQTQMGRVVLLRDMINWCIENPVRGAKLEPDSPEMRALEAYITSQRKGVEMNYGKH